MLGLKGLESKKTISTRSRKRQRKNLKAKDRDAERKQQKAA
jgi:hypothetical protein